MVINGYFKGLLITLTFFAYSYINLGQQNTVTEWKVTGSDELNGQQGWLIEMTNNGRLHEIEFLLDTDDWIILYAYKNAK